MDERRKYVGAIVYASDVRMWRYWNGGVMRDEDTSMTALRGRWPLALVHVQGELFGAETREAMNRADA